MQHGLASPFVFTQPLRLEHLTILHIIPALDDGPAAQTVVDLAEAAVDAGARALVASPGGTLVSELQARGGSWLAFPSDSRNPFAMANNVRKLRELIRAERPSVVHAHGQVAAWVALGATQLTGTPLVTSFGGRTAGWQAAAHHYDSVLARGDLVLVHSDHEGDAAAEAFPWVRERLRVVPAGVDVQRFSSTAVEPGRVEAQRAAWGVAADQRVVLAVRPAVREGCAPLLDAAALLRAEGPDDAVVVLAGEPSHRAAARELEDALAERGLGDRVRLAEPVAYADRPTALLAASVVVTCSAQPDACGSAALEAQAMGVPVVIADLGNAAEAVLSSPRVPAGQRTGWCVPPLDPDALAAALREALALGASARDVLATRARAHVERCFSRDRMADATLDAYVAVIEGRSPRTRASHG